MINLAGPDAARIKMPSRNETTGRAARTAEILVLGLGNAILGDDGVGWKVAEDVGRHLQLSHAVEVDCLAVGGLGLMERMLGYSRVILVDSIQTGSCPDGTVSNLQLGDLQDPGLGHTASAHDASLSTALQAAKALGAPIPERVDIVAIEARNCHDFSEELSPRIAAAVPVATRNVLDLLGPELRRPASARHT